jgi:HNH endonuclease
MPLLRESNRSPSRARGCGTPFPLELPYNINYSTGTTHPVFWTVAAEADHFVPHARGGSNELKNHRTACAMCNHRKGNCLVEEMQGWSVEEIKVDSKWDGLTSEYEAMCVRATFDLTRGQKTFCTLLATALQGNESQLSRPQSAGNPLDGYGRNVYVDTLDLAYSSGWRREHSALTHTGTCVFCCSFNPYPGHPQGKGRATGSPSSGPV